VLGKLMPENTIPLRQGEQLAIFASNSPMVILSETSLHETYRSILGKPCNEKAQKDDAVFNITLHNIHYAKFWI
jgi:hypothetical protein